jgi:hypothetical protein
VTGFDVTTNTVAPNAATIFFSLPSLYGHEIPGVNAATSLAAVRKRLAVVKDAFVLVINPPPVQGLGSAGGFKMKERRPVCEGRRKKSEFTGLGTG